MDLARSGVTTSCGVVSPYIRPARAEEFIHETCKFPRTIISGHGSMCRETLLMTPGQSESGVELDWARKDPSSKDLWEGTSCIAAAKAVSSCQGQALPAAEFWQHEGLEFLISDCSLL